ncbi:hypothetical protein TCAP_01167, partial [Tolypocladium capitatum]
GRRLFRRRLLVEDFFDGVGKPVDLHLLEDLGGRRRLVDEAAKHDGDAALAEVDAVDEVDVVDRGGVLEYVVRLADVVAQLEVDLDVGLGVDELDGDEGDDAEGAQAPGGVLEEVGIVGAAGRLEGAVAEDNLNVGDGVAEQAVAVHAALAGEARVAAADGDALELHDDLGHDAALEAVGGEQVHGHLGLGLDRHGVEVDGEDAVHVAGVDDGVAAELHRARGARGAMVDAEVLLAVVEVPDLLLDARNGSAVLLEELGLVHGWACVLAAAGARRHRPIEAKAAGARQRSKGREVRHGGRREAVRNVELRGTGYEVGGIRQWEIDEAVGEVSNLVELARVGASAAARACSCWEAARVLRTPVWPSDRLLRLDAESEPALDAGAARVDAGAAPAESKPQEPRPAGRRPRRAQGAGGAAWLEAQALLHGLRRRRDASCRRWRRSPWLGRQTGEAPARLRRRGCTDHGDWPGAGPAGASSRDEMPAWSSDRQRQCAVEQAPHGACIVRSMHHHIAWTTQRTGSASPCCSDATLRGSAAGCVNVPGQANDGATISILPTQIPGRSSGMSEISTCRP